MELVIGVLLLGVMFVGAALSRQGPGWVRAIVIWLAMWPLELAALFYPMVNGYLPRGMMFRSLAGAPLSPQIAAVSANLGLVASWGSGRVAVGLYAPVSVGSMSGGLVIFDV